MPEISMHTDVMIYWRDYRQNWIRQFAGEHAYFWHSNARVIGDLMPGDCLWIITSGKCLRREPQQAGFLVAVWQVERVADNPDDDPAYPADEYRFRVVADKVESLDLGDEPVPVDHILRPAGRDTTTPIGRFLQGPP